MPNKLGQIDRQSQTNEPCQMSAPSSSAMSSYSPELQDFLRHVEACLIDAGKRARALAEQTGTKYIAVDRQK